jgi:hypothetical protein
VLVPVDETLVVHLRVEDSRRLRALIERTGIKRDDVVRLALCALLEQLETCRPLPAAKTPAPG